MFRNILQTNCPYSTTAIFLPARDEMITGWPSMVVVFCHMLVLGDWSQHSVTPAGLAGAQMDPVVAGLYAFPLQTYSLASFNCLIALCM